MSAKLAAVQRWSKLAWQCPTCDFINDPSLPTAQTRASATGVLESVCLRCGAAKPARDSEVAENADACAVLEERQKLFVKAAETLVRCRAMLVWTFVWAFYEYSDDVRNLFEYCQRDLERYTEQLSLLIENGSRAGARDARPRANKQLLEALSADSGAHDSLHQARARNSEVQALTLALSKFLGAMQNFDRPGGERMKLAEREGGKRGMDTGGTDGAGADAGAGTA